MFMMMKDKATDGKFFWIVLKLHKEGYRHLRHFFPALNNLEILTPKLFGIP